MVILSEAGGLTTEWREGKDFRATGHILATNRRIHEHLRSVLLSGDSSAIRDEWDF